VSESIKQISFSVVTVVYNGAEVIEETLLSCIGQDYSNMEYIVIDGASTDKTIEIINKYKDKISKLLSEPDHGIYDAMNKAIKMATGEWILFMNCGDRFCDRYVLSMIASEIKTLETYPDVIYGNTFFLFKDASLKMKPMSLDKIKREMVFCHQSSLVRTELIKSFDFDLRYRLAADYDMMLKFYIQKRSFQYVDIYISIFNQMDGDTLRNYKLSTKERFSAQKDSGTVKNSCLMYKSLLRIQLGLFVKKIIPAKLKGLIFSKKYKKFYM
jgi:glycosyltransferase involved in cell wall biosynthesis